jgi:HlyD family secretion protein
MTSRTQPLIFTMKPLARPSTLFLACAAAVAVGWAAQAAQGQPKPPASAASAAKPALTVTVTQPQASTLPLSISANGSLAAWQEASVGTEANGLRLAEVRVNVGDVVRRGQVLATFGPEVLRAEAAQARAAMAEAQAVLAEASANAQRARTLQSTGALSESVISQARVEAQRSVAQLQQLRLRQTQVLAPDDGVISARSATVGAVLPAGQELFRMVRQGRLEWRGEVAASELAALKPGMEVVVTPAGSASLKGRLRMVAPTVDPLTRNGLVYVDVPAASGARAGMFAQGDFALGSSPALTLPQSAVQLRDGFSHVLLVGADSRVSQVKVKVGRRLGERVEISSSLPPNARVVTAGGGFLSDGDTVRVVEAATTAPTAAAPAAPAAPAVSPTSSK